MHARHRPAVDLLNPWQHGFPLVREPFSQIAATLGRSVPEVLAAYAALQRDGALSRIGGVFGAAAGGAALLAAMTVPADRLHEVAAIVSAHPGVNHNYEREHAFNLWFVVTGTDPVAVEQAVRSLEDATDLAALRLRMERAYRIDLGFDLRHSTAQVPMAAAGRGEPIAAADRPLAALLEGGLPLIERPFDAWADSLHCPVERVLATLQGWLQSGALKRFGTIVRHHELGFDANAMTVFDVPDARVDACGEALAAEPGITLSYRRERAPGWPFNLYCMVHGRDRDAVRDVLARVIPRCGLAHHPHAVLFSRRRFKQTGARRFRDLPSTTPILREAPHAAP
jgi:DNA-binding Lrp family transcriptional regulator